MSSTCAWCQDLAAKQAEAERDEAREKLEAVREALFALRIEAAQLRAKREDAK